MRLWRFGGVLAEVEARAVTSLLDELLAHRIEALVVALELMVMYAHGRLVVLDELRPQILRAVKSVIPGNQFRGDTRTAHHLERVMTWILRKCRPDPDARSVASTLSTAPLVPRLLADSPKTSWPLIGQAMDSDRSWG